MKALAICSGIGGIELVLKLVIPDLEVLCYVEKESFPSKILKSRMRDGILQEAPIWPNTETFDSNDWIGRVDIIAAGFPCQPWSVAGKQKGTNDDRCI